MTEPLRRAQVEDSPCLTPSFWAGRHGAASEVPRRPSAQSAARSASEAAVRSSRPTGRLARHRPRELRDRGEVGRARRPGPARGKRGPEALALTIAADEPTAPARRLHLPERAASRPHLGHRLPCAAWRTHLWSLRIRRSTGETSPPTGRDGAAVRMRPVKPTAVVAAFGGLAAAHGRQHRATVATVDTAVRVTAGRTRKAAVSHPLSMSAPSQGGGVRTPPAGRSAATCCLVTRRLRRRPARLPDRSGAHLRSPALTAGAPPRGRARPDPARRGRSPRARRILSPSPPGAAPPPDRRQAPRRTRPRRTAQRVGTAKARGPFAG